MRDILAKLKLSFLIFSTILFFGVIVIILIKDNADNKFTSMLNENNLIMQGARITYVIDNDTFINVNAKNANADLSVNYIAMRDVEFKYHGGKANIIARADNGVYELNRLITATGNLEGFMDNASFITGSEGKLVYDYSSAKGNIENGVTAFFDNNSIYSDSVEFDINLNYISFEDNVSVRYYTNETGEVNVKF